MVRAWDEEEAPASKKARKAEGGEEEAEYRPTAVLEPGAVVIYWDGWRGVIRDSFDAIDGFWVADEESDVVVRDEDGEIVTFKSKDLKLVAPPPKVVPGHPQAPEAGVLLVGTEQQMVKVLEHFGTPDPDKRTEPQELLAIPCSLCDPSTLLRTAREGVTASTLKLSQKQRPELHVALRAYHLKQALEQCMPLLCLENYFVLAGVTVPYSVDDIKASKDLKEKRWRKSIANQLDVAVTAYGRKEAEASSLLEVAQQALGNSCGMCLSEELWDKDTQMGIRAAHGVSELPLHFVDDVGARVFVALLPEDAVVEDDAGILMCRGAPGSDYAAAAKEDEAAEPAAPEAESKEEADSAADSAAKASEAPQAKTVGQWEDAQDQFGDQPKLPPGWIRVKSRSTGKVYFYNKATDESSFEPPLPEGWTKQTSKSTGKTYYFHARTSTSTFVRPSA